MRIKLSLMEITAITGSDAYLVLLAALLDNHAVDTVSPRGMPVREVRNVQLVIHDPGEVHVLSTARFPRRTIAATEAVQLISGTSSLEQLDHASGGRFSQFADRGRLRGAYGPRAFRGLKLAVARLAADQDTRQAVVSLWREDELATASNDMPCTISWQFLIRNGRLEMRTSMRSNDAWLGVPFDLEMFSVLHRTLAHALDVPAGQYAHSVGSMHLYDRDVGRAHRILDVGIGKLPHQNPVPVPAITCDVPQDGDFPEARWQRSVRTAALIMRGLPTADRVTEERLWLRATVPVIFNGSFLCPHCRYWLPQPCMECAPDGAENVAVGDVL